MSFLRYMSLVSFRKYHPDWDMVLVLRRGKGKPHPWEQRQDTKYYNGKDYRDQAMKISGLELLWLEDAFPGLVDYYENQVSDMLGWEWVQGGGMKCDMDLLWRASIDYLAIKDIQVGVWAYRKTFAVGVVLGNEPGFFKHLYEKGMGKLLNGRDSLDYQDIGPGLLVQEFSGLQGRFVIKTLPNSWLYPFVDIVSGWNQMCSQPFICNGDLSLPSKCSAVHWYAGSNASMKWNLKPVSEIIEADNIIGNIIRQVLG